MSDAATQADAPAPADTAPPAAAPAPETPTPDAGTAPTPAPTPNEVSPVGTPLAEDTPAEGNATHPNGSDDGAVAHEQFMASLDADTQKLFADKGYKSVNDLSKAYRELTTKLGQKPLEVPAPDAPQDEWDTFNNHFRPENPEGYQYQMPQGVPENIPYDADFANEFKIASHQAGLRPDQSAMLHDFYVTRMAGQMGAVAEATAAKVGEAHKKIVSEWGEPGTEAYNTQQSLAARALKQLNLQQSFQDSGILDAQTGNVTSPEVAFALARIGRAMFAEDSLYSGPSNLPDNPFSNETANMTKASLLIKNDPARALTLIRAAGKKPSDFGLED